MHAQSQYMDYFTATPIVDKLSSTCWGEPQVGARDQSNGLEDKGMTQWAYWDGAIIKGEDNLYHMFASRWDQAKGHTGWMSDSHAVHATSPNLYGPYTEKGLCFTDNNGLGHNVGILQLRDGDASGKKYAIILSGGLTPGSGRIYGANSLNGPWTYLGDTQIASGQYSSTLSTGNNFRVILRPDGKYEAIVSNFQLATSDNILGPYTVQTPSLFSQIPDCPIYNMEDPLLFYSGDRYHAVFNKWDTRKAYHFTSSNGVDNWKMEKGNAYDPTVDFIRYSNNTVNHWRKLERPFAYIENGHVVAMTFAAIDVEKEQDLANDLHGSKIIVVPFDGVKLDSAYSSPTFKKANKR
ncbi:MAG: glycoside hydrolase family protein [Ferruginibacter sp.]